MNSNLILNTDSYKASHFLQYPPGTERVSSYIEARGAEEPFDPSVEVVPFGLQSFLKNYLSHDLWGIDISQAKSILEAHGEPFNFDGWEYILNAHGGKLPIEVSAIPEGTPIPPGHPLVQVINTDTKVPWLTSYVETALLRALWYPTTVATLSREAKKIIKHYLEKTSDSLEGLPFKLHDFGARGVSSEESAALGGAGHLVNFMGTDTLSAVLEVYRSYNATSMPAFSIPAAEHSTITSWGEKNEREAYKNMLERFGGPGKLVAVVSDSYDLWNALSIWKTLNNELVNSGTTLVVRPDSGEPTKIVPEVIMRLMHLFGYTTNKKDYDILPNYLRVIQGDGIYLASIAEILKTVAGKRLSTDNLAMGMGGGLLQQINRDSLRFAMKASAIQVNGAWRDVFKNPKTDPSKASKKGRFGLVKRNGVFQTLPLNDTPDSENLLVPVWRNGSLLVDDNFDTIRGRAAL